MLPAIPCRAGGAQRRAPEGFARLSSRSLPGQAGRWEVPPGRPRSPPRGRVLQPHAHPPLGLRRAVPSPFTVSCYFGPNLSHSWANLYIFHEFHDVFFPVDPPQRLSQIRPSPLRALQPLRAAHLPGAPGAACPQGAPCSPSLPPPEEAGALSSTASVLQGL